MPSLTKVFKLSGNFGKIQARKLRKELNETIENGNTIILDLKNVTFMDSAGLAALVLIQKRVKVAGGKLFLSSISEPVKMLFELTSMERVFEIIT